MVNVYSVYSLESHWRQAIFEAIGRAQMDGVTWYFTCPPIQGLEYEIDARRALQKFLFLSSYVTIYLIKRTRD